MKIVIVEGAQHVREGLGQSLERQGHNVIQCASGQEALLRADSYGADLLVAGEQLPDMTSVQMANHLRQWAPFRALSVVVLKKPRTKEKTAPVLH